MMRIHCLALAIMIGLVIGLAVDYDIALAKEPEWQKKTCQDLLDNNTYRCMVKDETGKEFEDCLRFVSPGGESEDFDMSSDKFGGAFGCECKPTGSFYHPNWGQSRAFFCVYGYSTDDTYSVISSEGFVTANGEHIIKGSAVNNEGLFFVFRCVQDPDCELPVVVETNCFDKIDNDDDGLTDCADLDCSAVTGGACDTGQLGICGPGTLQCVDGQEICVQDNQPITEGPYGNATCSDSLDNDCDGLTDDSDSDCSPLAESDCFDEVDNNGDGLIDCADPTCDGIQGSPTECGTGECFSTGFQICQGGTLVDTCQAGTPTAEICDGLDQNCDGIPDNGAPSVMCPSTLNVVTTFCNLGECEITTCLAGYGDIDGVYPNGCECAPDLMEFNNDCANITDFGDVYQVSPHNTILVTARLSTEDDEDWYKVRAVDDVNNIQSFQSDQRIEIEFDSNPGDEFRFDVFRDVDGNCDGAPPVQSGSTIYYYYGFPQYCEPVSFCDWSQTNDCFSCKDLPPPAPDPWPFADPLCNPQYNDCSGTGGLNCVKCYERDDTAYFYIRVYRRLGLSPSCNSYTLRIRNRQPPF